MAAFKGVFPAPVWTSAPYGLLSVADVATSATPGYDEHWLWNYYSAMFDTRPQAVKIVAKDNSADYDIYVSGEPDSLYEDIQPFFIEVTDSGSTMGLLAEDRFERILKQIDSASQKAVEHEFWEGDATKAVSGTAPYLTKQNGATILTTSGVDPKKALYLLEQSIANSPTGSGGVIHLTRDVASVLFAGGGFVVKDSGVNGEPQIFTPLGTPVVIGSGYTGAGPDGATGAAPSASNKWAYVTGPVGVVLGDSQVDNEDLARSIKTDTNDINLTANRPAAVHFDPTLFYTVQITLPDTP